MRCAASSGWRPAIRWSALSAGWWRKKDIELFDALRLVRARFPRVRLLMIGPVDSDRADAIQPSTADAYGIGDITVFTGYRHDMPELYALMHVCVLPSHREGMPRSPMEAAAMGVPCVATAIRGCREVVRDRETGLLVPVNDAAALAGGIGRILGDDEMAAGMAARARQVACEQFDERLVFERVRLAYDRLLRDRTAASPSWIKRAADLVIASVVLVLFLPVLAVIAAAVRIALGSPVLFRQMRPGLHGRPFELLKFRTLRDARGSGGEMLPDAQRMTRLGRWLRRTSLDELPELLNVLKGEMSLVGPRPLLMQYLSRYTPRPGTAPRRAARHHRAGAGQRTERGSTWEERFDLDVWYVDHWSLWLDVRILLRTVGKVIIGEGVAQPGHDTAAEFMGSPVSTTLDRRMAADALFILGASGHGMVVCDIVGVAGEGLRAVGFVDANPSLHGTHVLDLPVVGTIEEVASRGIRHVAMGIGDNAARRRVFARVLELGLQPVTAVHPSAVVSSHATVARGTVVMANATINVAARIGENAIINTRRASIITA